MLGIIAEKADKIVLLFLLAIRVPLIRQVKMTVLGQRFKLYTCETPTNISFTNNIYTYNSVSYPLPTLHIYKYHW